MTDTWKHAEIRCSGLSDGEGHSTLESSSPLLRTVNREVGSLPTAEQGSMVITITHRYNKVSWLLFYTVGQGEFSQLLQGTTPQALNIWGWRGVMVNISCIQYQHSHSGQRKGLISL